MRGTFPFYCGGGEIGRHAGLKILWTARPFGFESRSPHTSIVRSKKDFNTFSVLAFYGAQFVLFLLHNYKGY